MMSLSVEGENDNKLNVADDDEIKHEGVQNHDLPPPFLIPGLPLAYYKF